MNKKIKREGNEKMKVEKRKWNKKKKKIGHKKRSKINNEIHIINEYVSMINIRIKHNAYFFNIKLNKSEMKNKDKICFRLK